jgi:glycosyltransferase involved in cell wall biosynthesis
VVIPAFRAVATIKECVSAIACSTADAEIEIVVVDDGENPGLDHFLSHLPVTIKRTGGSGSAAVARNLGAADFPSGVLLFVDADVVVRPDTGIYQVDVRQPDNSRCFQNNAPIGVMQRRRFCSAKCERLARD